MKDLSLFVQATNISKVSQIIAEDNDFTIKSFRFLPQTYDHPKVVKIGSIQTSIEAPTTAPVDEQKEVIFRKVEKMIDVASRENVNILCLPEMWYMPYPFYTPENVAWRDFAEDAENGASSIFIKTLAAKFRIVIILPILERELDLFFNTTLVISTSGKLIGKYRKIHIPPIEEPYLQAGDFEQPVIDTEFGKIGILICYERHFPLCWMMKGLEQADIVFNPSAEDENSLSERLWFPEGINAAVANGFFTVLVNKTGIEKFSNGSSFCYFGSNYVASPDGYITPHLPRAAKDGMLITEIDLNVCRKVKSDISIHRKKHLDLYSDKLNKVKYFKSENK